MDARSAMDAAGVRASLIWRERVWHWVWRVWTEAARSGRGEWAGGGVGGLEEADEGVVGLHHDFLTTEDTEDTEE